MLQSNLTTGVFVGAGNQFDLNNDNTINEADITEWLDLAGMESGCGSPFLRGHTDGMDNTFPTPRTVDNTDFQDFLVGFTGVGSIWGMRNFNGDALVDITDFSNHFLPSFATTGGGTYGPGQSIPKPSIMLLLGLGGVFLAFVCRLI